MYPDYPDNFIYPTYKKSKLEELRGHKVVPIILHVQFAVDRSNLPNVHCTVSSVQGVVENPFLAISSCYSLYLTSELKNEDLGTLNPDPLI